jgi:hypothetical protein
MKKVQSRNLVASNGLNPENKSQSKRKHNVIMTLQIFFKIKGILIIHRVSWNKHRWNVMSSICLNSIHEGVSVWNARICVKQHQWMKLKWWIWEMETRVSTNTVLCMSDSIQSKDPSREDATVKHKKHCTIDAICPALEFLIFFFYWLRYLLRNHIPL